MSWRKVNFILHRDIGFFCIGLTLLYGVSGIVVNHISNSFNPSYTIEKSVEIVSPLPNGNKPDMNYIQSVLQEIGEDGVFKNAALVSPKTLRIFVEGNTLDVQLETGRVAMEKVQRKPILYEINYLHLNKAKGVWTWLADIYALALCLLALTGMLMIRGKNKKRSIILTSAGILLPVIYLFVAL